MQITTSWHEKGEAIGEARGRAKGEVQGEIKAKQDAISTFMTAKFNADPADIQGKLRHLSNKDVLDRLMKDVFTADSAMEAYKKIGDAAKKVVQ